MKRCKTKGKKTVQDSNISRNSQCISGDALSDWCKHWSSIVQPSSGKRSMTDSFSVSMMKRLAVPMLEFKTVSEHAQRVELTHKADACIPSLDGNVNPRRVVAPIPLLQLEHTPP